MLRQLLCVLAFALLAGCGKAPSVPAPGRPPASDAAARAAVLLLAEADLRTLAPASTATGPLITGSLQPERRADLRAEVSAVVTQVLKENGEAVRAGDLLVRLDATAIRDSVATAEEAVRAAELAALQSERQVARQRTLQAQGMTPTQALEDAEVRRNVAQSDLVAARGRLVAARQQLQRTEVRAPFDGVVSERRVSVGDTAQVGKELLKVIDPASLRFEGLVSADRMGEVRSGQAVSFRVIGVPQAEFAGRVLRVGASANAITRQVEVLVGFVERDAAPRVAGLFAEGRIASTTTRALVLPESSLVRQGDAAHVWRVAQGRLEKVPVRVGERDARRGEYPVLDGLAEGDRVLRHPGANLIDGQRVEFAATPPERAPASASPRE